MTFVSRCAGHWAPLLLWYAALILISSSVHGVEIRLLKGTRLNPYNRFQYRQLPYQAIGIYSKDSFMAHITGHSDVHPLVEIAVDALQGPNRYFQVYLYNADVVEGTIVPSLERGGVAASPCMDIGQASGVAIFDNMTHDAFGLNAGALMVGSAAEYSFYTVRGQVYPETTGLYIVTMNACHFVNHTHGKRSLVISGWTDVEVSGVITVRNPFGYLPGQAYGFLPAYNVLLLISAVVTVVVLWYAYRVGRDSLLGYHWVLLTEAVLSTVAYGFLYGYYQTLNQHNSDLYGVFVVGRLVLIVRNTVGMAALFLICYGYYLLTQRFARGVLGLLVVGLLLRFGLNMAEFALFQWSTNLGATTGLWGVSSQQSANLGWKVTRVFGMFVDGVLGAASVVCLWRTSQQLSALKQKRRLALVRRTGAVLLAGGALGLLWAAVVGWYSDGPLGTVGEVHWKFMWLPEVLYELVSFATFTALVLVWLPKRVDLEYFRAEAADGSPSLDAGKPSSVSSSRSSPRSSEDGSMGGAAAGVRRRKGLRSLGPSVGSYSDSDRNGHVEMDAVHADRVVRQHHGHEVLVDVHADVPAEANGGNEVDRGSPSHHRDESVVVLPPSPKREELTDARGSGRRRHHASGGPLASGD